MGHQGRSGRAEEFLPGQSISPKLDGDSVQMWTPGGHAESTPSPVFLISREAEIMGPG